MKTLIVILTLMFAMTANAGFINYVDEIEKAGGLGESAWSTLSVVDDEGFTATIRSGTGAVYADWGNAGLGVCGNPTSIDILRSGDTSNRCNPSSDDGLNSGETLFISYDIDVTLQMFLNANHDGGLNAGSNVLVDGVLTDISGGSTGFYALAANTEIGITGTSSGSFYLDGLVSVDNRQEVSEPAPLFLSGLGLLVLGLGRKLRK